MTARTKDCRRRWRTLSTVAATAVAVLLVATGAGASTSPQQPTPAYPTDPLQIPPGTKIPLTVRGGYASTDGIINGAPIFLPEMKGGITFTVLNPDAPEQGSLHMEVTEFSLTGKVVPAPGAEQSDTTVTITMGDRAGISGESLLRPSPPQWEHSMTLPLYFSIENPPQEWSNAAGVEQAEPLILTAKAPAELTATLSGFPPVDGRYSLKQPVELVSPNEPDKPVGTLEELSLQINGH
jgi:hypothetical protein